MTLRAATACPVFGKRRLAVYIHPCCSSVGAPNRTGQVFSFQEFKLLLMTDWIEDGAYNYVEFLQRRFVAFCFLLGALRSCQMDRFRAAGLANCSYYRDHRDVNNFKRPMVKSVYAMLLLADVRCSSLHNSLRVRA